MHVKGTKRSRDQPENNIQGQNLQQRPSSEQYARDRVEIPLHHRPNPSSERNQPTGGSSQTFLEQMAQMVKQMACIDKRLEQLDHNYNILMQQQTTAYNPFRHNQYPLPHGPPGYPQPPPQQVPQTILQRPSQPPLTSQ